VQCVTQFRVGLAEQCVVQKLLLFWCKAESWRHIREDFKRVRSFPRERRFPSGANQIGVSAGRRWRNGTATEKGPIIGQELCSRDGGALELGFAVDFKHKLF
jgi:hypothetical protein